MGKEAFNPAYIPKRNQIARTVLDKVVSTTPFFRSEIINPERLEAAREILRNGMGLCIIANHFSRKEPAHMFQIPFRDSEFRKRKIVAALAAHQSLFFMNPLSRLLAVKVKYIVTEETLKRAKEKSKQNLEKNAGASEFMNDALGALSGGGIVIILPQATRRESLYPNDHPRTMGTFMAAAKKSGIRLGFLFVGVDLAEEVEDYSKVRGFNPLKKYKLTVGNSLTDEELLKQAGRLGKVDEIVYRELTGLVSPRYANVAS